MKTETKCLECNNLFMAEKRELNRGRAKYCSGKHHTKIANEEYNKNHPANAVRS